MINRDPQVEIETKEKVDEAIQKAVEEFLAVEEPKEGEVVQEIHVDEEYRQLELQHLRLKKQAE